jgi:hypothetical protein
MLDLSNLSSNGNPTAKASAIKMEIIKHDLNDDNVVEKLAMPSSSLFMILLSFHLTNNLNFNLR